MVVEHPDALRKAALPSGRLAASFVVFCFQNYLIYIQAETGVCLRAV